MTSVRLAGVERRFGSTAVLRGIDLEVASGECVALLGPSGCGKSTLLRLVAGLDEPDAGRIELGGRVVADPASRVPPEQRRVGLVFQDGVLFPHLDVAANVGFGLDRAQRRGGPRVQEVLELVGLAELADRDPATLSGGQAQRVALARALAPRPEVLLLDEPFSNLDAPLRHRLRREVRDVVRATGVTTVFVTHDRDEAFLLGDRLALMHDGRILQVDRPDVVYRSPTDRWSAEFLGEVVDLPDGTWVRPEQLVVGPPGSGTWPGRVLDVEFAGPTTTVVVEVAGGVAVRVQVTGDAPTLGAEVAVARR